MKVLNLYSGIGGNRKLWDECLVTAVELDPKIARNYKERFPQDVVLVDDAHKYLLENAEHFDFIWSSPPCQSHSRMAKAGRNRKPRYPDLQLYEEILFLQNNYSGKYVVENVVPYYTPLIEPTAKIGRHIFWSNVDLSGIEDVARPKGFINKTTVAGSEELKEWLGIHYDGNIYYDGNHCPAQVLRNAVHPELGSRIYQRVKGDKLL